VTDDPEIHPEVLAGLRAICLGLPETYEEQAWVGIRWLVRKKTFAHVLRIHEDSPPALAKVQAVAELPVTVVTFRSVGHELQALRSSGYPFFYAGWGRDVVAMALDEATDWDEVRELLTESYCVLAPKKLQAQVARPDA
jgi:hypothetical protein